MHYFDVQLRHDTGRPSDGPEPSDELDFLVVGEPGATKDDALAALRAEASTHSPGGLRLKRCRITGNPTDASDVGDQVFYGTAEYSTGEKSEDKEAGETSYSFDTTGGTFHVTQAKEEVHVYAVGDDGPPFYRVIGATSDGVEGTDITIPQYGFSVTAYIADADVTNSYRGIIYALTGTTNNAEFFGLAVGECLFLGARGSKRGRGDWEVTFAFAGSPNVTGLTISGADGTIGPIAKKGWDYLWVRYEKREAEPPLYCVTQVPIGVIIDRVYDPGNHALLGIGTA